MNPRIAIAVVLALTPAAALGHDYKAGDLAIDHPWSRATPQGAQVAGGYLKITNGGQANDRLVGGTADVATRIELHEIGARTQIAVEEEAFRRVALSHPRRVDADLGEHRRDPHVRRHVLLVRRRVHRDESFAPP